MTKDERAKLIDEAIRLTWGSLQSHLEWTKEGRRRKIDGSTTFHKKCVKDYSRVMEILSQLY